MSMMRGHIEAKAADRDMLAAAYANFNGEPTPVPTAKVVDKIQVSASFSMKSAVKRAYSRRAAGLERPAYTAARKLAFEVIKREMENGARFSQAFKAAGVSRVTAVKMCKEHNFTISDQVSAGVKSSIETRSRKAREARDAAAIQLRVYIAQGLNRKAAAAMLGINETTVAKIAKEHDLTFPASPAK